MWNVDVAGHTAQLPQILQKAGIRGLVISAGATDNTFDDPYLLHETRGPYLFRWQAPDGSSVPTWSTPWGYSAGDALGLRKPTPHRGRLVRSPDTGGAECAAGLRWRAKPAA